MDCAAGGAAFRRALLPLLRRASRRGAAAARCRTSAAASASSSRAPPGSARPRSAVARLVRAGEQLVLPGGRLDALDRVEVAVLADERSAERGHEPRRVATRRRGTRRPAARPRRPAAGGRAAAGARPAARPDRRPVSAAGSRTAGTLRNRSRWTLAAASKTPRSSSSEGDRRSPCSTAFANVNVCSAVSQSSKSLLVGKRAIRIAAAKVTAEASSTSVAPSRSASSSASMRRRRLAFEQRRDERVAADPSCPRLSAPAASASGSSLERALEQRGEVDGVAPRVRLLHPLGEGELSGQRREHGLGALPARRRRAPRAPC